MLTVRLWGVRGSLPTPRREMLRYGGNTPCVEVRTDSALLAIDAGTGIVGLGERLANETGIHVHLLFSHCHWDHIQGFPFFRPLYDESTWITLYGATEVTGHLEQNLRNQMENPYFPVGLEQLSAKRDFVQIGSPAFEIGDVRVVGKPLVHPGGVLGFRIEHESGTVVYASDNELGEGDAIDRLVDLARGADLLIADAQFSPEEYEPAKRGWGHATWEQAARAAAAAEVGQLALFHHDPWHTDEVVFSFECAARRIFEGTVAGAEGAEFVFPPLAAFASAAG